MGSDLTPITQNRVRSEVINLTVRSFNYAPETSDRYLQRLNKSDLTRKIIYGFFVFY